MKKTVIILAIVFGVLGLGALTWFGGIKGGWFKHWFGNHHDNPATAIALTVVPSDAFLAVPINTATLARKLELDQRQAVHSPDPFLRYLDNPKESGLEFGDWWFGFGITGLKHEVVGVSAPLRDAKQFASYTKAQGKPIISTTRYQYSVFLEKSQVVGAIAWDDTRALAVWRFDADSLTKKPITENLDRLFGLKEEERLVTNPAFSKFLTTVTDAGYWINARGLAPERMLTSEEYAQLPSALRNSVFLTSENRLYGNINFENGNVQTASKYDYSNEVRKQWERYFGKRGSHVGNQLLGYIPGDRLLYLHAVSIDLPNALHELEKQARADSLLGPKVDQLLKSAALLGVESKDLYNTLTGDFVFSVNASPTDPKHPRILLAAAMGKSDALHLILSRLIDYGVIESKGKYYRLAMRGGPNVCVAMTDDVLLISMNSSFAVEDAVNGRKPVTPLPEDIVKRAISTPYYLHLDLQASLDQVSLAIPQSPDLRLQRVSREIRRAKGTFRSLDISGDSQGGQMTMTTAEPSTNSLKFILKQYETPAR